MLKDLFKKSSQALATVSIILKEQGEKLEEEAEHSKLTRLADKAINIHNRIVSIKKLNDPVLNTLLYTLEEEAELTQSLINKIKEEREDNNED